MRVARRFLLGCVAGVVGLLRCAGSDEASTPAIVAERSIAAMRERAAVPGVAVAVAQNGHVLWSGGFGFADLAHGAPVTAETRFGLGSLTKPLTTALIARLVERGVLEWDAPVERYLPDFPHRGRGMTLRHIAAHLAGFGDEFDRAYAQTTERFATATEVLPLVGREPLQSEPGSRSYYATGSYTVLAAVVEQVTGLSFAEAMLHEVLAPLGLEGIQPNDRSRASPGRAEFYARDDAGRAVPAPFVDFSHKWAGAGFQASAVEIALFASHLAEGKIVGPERVQELFTAQRTNDGAATPFGLGWAIGARAGFGMRWVIGPDEPPRRIVHHPGGGHGISCWLVIDLETRLVVAMLANQSGAPVGGRVFDEVFEAFLAEVLPAP